MVEFRKQIDYTGWEYEKVIPTGVIMEKDYVRDDE